MCIEKEVKGLTKLLERFIFLILMVIVITFIVVVGLIAKYL